MLLLAVLGALEEGTLKTSDASYGVHWNIAPAKKQKRVVIHALPCSHYRQQARLRKGTYSFNKNCSSFEDAVNRASSSSLEWHAPIRLCRDCVKARRF